MAKNYMAEVAEMLGVELGEKFKLKEDGRIVECMNDEGGCNDVLFQITEEGVDHDGTWFFSDNDNVNLLFYIIAGEYEIVKMPWEPKRGDEYYLPSAHKKAICQSKWCGDTMDLALKALNMVYRTPEEAEEHLAEDYKKLTGREYKK